MNLSKIIDKDSSRYDKYLEFISCIDLLITNCSRSFQETQVIETGVSDFHEMNLTVLKMFFTKQKYETIFYKNYKKFDNLKIKEALNRKQIEHDLNNIDYENLLEIMLSILNAHAPLKKKHLKANHASFVTKEFRKAVMKRARLRNVYLKKRTEATKAAYNYQQNICVSLLRK